uniref:Carboxysome shell carbonic anhydrase n=1 Tax=Hydrogenovibrio crunogenus (strain DSM 25203 / XCL-2) TaxID=317025 RepID=CSOCA_HYDCU|nr:RecName: Full=Carboxysome shell carbonic anhydrase; Short=CsoSCA; AltName: Full=Carbonic anhydrase; Short=CA; AltName: Full=Carboxysome shell protein CsoS3 [Hydrogenovibrio crunogenus XCL-2]
MNRLKKSHRQKSLFWRPIAPNPRWQKENPTAHGSTDTGGFGYNGGNEEVKTSSTMMNGIHALVNERQNEWLRGYEVDIKSRFDNIESVLKDILAQQSQLNFVSWANQQLFAKLGVSLTEQDWQSGVQLQSQKGFQFLYGKTLFAQFMRMSEDFFVNDPLSGQRKQEAERMFKEAGFHAVGIAPCADGRLAHILSYVLRLPYALARRKAHAGVMFDVSESVRNWVFIEHTRFRDGQPNLADEPTRYLKIAVYHFSKADPTHQGCAAHGSDDHKAAQAALQKLKDFKQAIENRFGCGSTVQTLLLGLNTDDDSMKVHIPNASGEVCLDRYVETEQLYQATMNLPDSEAKQALENAIVTCNQALGSTAPQPELVKLLSWLIGNNFSQIAYVNQYENGCYSDIGHAERFIGIGNGFEEVQLRNLSYYSFLDTVEEGVNDVDVGIKIFKGLNVKKGLPIPIIIRCDYDGRVPGSKDRAEAKALRIEKALHNRYQELSAPGLLQTLPTLRDFTSCKPAERLPGLADLSAKQRTA